MGALGRGMLVSALDLVRAKRGGSGERPFLGWKGSGGGAGCSDGGGCGSVFIL